MGEKKRGNDFYNVWDNLRLGGVSEEWSRGSLFGRRGLFVVADGLDGIGKGVVERALIEFEQKLHKAVFDTIAFSKARAKGLPELSDFWDPPESHYDSVVTAEPTYAGIGHNIRNEIILRNGRNYSSSVQIQMYGLDRLIQMRRVVVPALMNGLNVIQSRSMTSTICYQSSKAIDEGRDLREVRDEILSHEGNAYQLTHPPDLLIIPTVPNIKVLERRWADRKERAKDDNSEFENLRFQAKISPYFSSDQLRKLFESRGTVVKYIDAAVSEEHTRSEAVRIYREFLDSRSN